AAGIDRLVHVSAIGADKSSNAKYARTKAEAETAILAAVPKAVILRPSIVFGPEDDFFNRFATMASGPMSSILPLMPAIGGGKTKLQPVYAGDVADAIVAAVTRDDVAGKIYELGGPRTYTFNELYDLIFKEIGRRRFKIPLPFWFAQSLGLFFGAAFRVKSFLIGSLLGGPPLTADQVKMLKTDNVVASDALTLADLGITEIESAETIVPTYLWRFRPYGEFSQAGEA
ncbi:MAG: complex I NDUFA9 subunit family protein, partial [Pseudomonadota bacterium]